MEALRSHGGSATNSEISAYVVRMLDLSEEQQEVTRADGRAAQIEQSLAEAKSHLKTDGLVERSRRGVWSFTELGEHASPDRILDAPRNAWRRRAEARRARDAADAEALDVVDDGSQVEEDASVEEEVDDADSTDEEERWDRKVVSRMLAMSPAAFEALAQRLLREAGFVNVKVRGRSGDGGIDGEGVYRPLPLIGFQVYWQSKRYTGTVSAEEIRNFRGAMVGRGDKGLFITTGTFTGPAREEAAREGAPPIDLIDGKALAGLLAEYELGVERREVLTYRHTVDESFWENFAA